MSASPVVYFIDDSATMREVIKIAFRRENMNVIACHDAGSAIGMMEETAPDVVISDVIMPEKDGYEVCQYIKQHPKMGRTPVILMSGVVNRTVAEKAFAVKADELIRKPFQPQDLIGRVRHLLQSKTETPASASPLPAVVAQSAAMAALSSIFQAPAAQARPSLAVVPRIPVQARSAAASATATVEASASAADGAERKPRVPHPPLPQMDAARLRVEIRRLQSQVKKLEAELQAEREYSRALEEHVKTLQESE